MMISGTRAAIVVPFAGLACFIAINKQWKWIVAGSFIFILAFGFFNYTNIGQGNSDIRRMRTAFKAEHDDSYNLRLDNQKKMRQFMSNYPFGVGIGSAKHTEEGDLLYKLPTDTSFVYVWVETGIVGLILYLGILLTVLGYGIYYVMLKLKHPLIRGITAAFTSGFAGMLLAGYANEVLHQFPTGPTLYMLMTFIMLSPWFDKELGDEKQSQL
jgi:O-antigen ligase